ncbi:MAG: phenylacetate--CoA ligase family protein [Theionarchaea archaeon]|nr:phenylacetate--CoA ligase family protein [Theionarchaea archaeon]MBU7001009.1 phenylacetate--CoA ligase family protein [Theionarchaea archaeon]
MLLETAQLLCKIRKEQWLSPDILEDIQQERLRKMVGHAYKNTRFYRDVFNRCGITPQDIKTKEDLATLPPTTKSDLQDRFRDLIASGYSTENCYVYNTSGSTGTPATVLYDPYTKAYTGAEDYVFMFDVGYRPWEKIAYTKRKPWASHPLQALGIMRACHILSSLPEEEQARLLQEIHPSLIISYPILLHSIARAARSEHYTVHPRAVIVGGELLTPQVRSFIEEVLSTSLYETYATVEFATIAKECSHHNWHIHSTRCLVEFVEGKILVTGLINKALPLLRYEIGDMGAPKNGLCPCGRGYPMMQILEGRLGDLFILPNGREIPPLRVFKTRLILDSNVAAKRYQIIQEDYDHFIIRVVPTSNFTKAIAQQLREQLVEDLQYPVNVEIDEVDEIPLIDDRKLRVNISRVKKNHCEDSV